MTTATLQALVRDLQARHDDTGETQRALIAEIDALLGERVAVAQTLTDFYRAPLSMSSVQPLLALAERLNPSLRRETAMCVPAAQRCDATTIHGGAHGTVGCSLDRGHVGPHVAYNNHFPMSAKLSEWTDAH